MSFSLAFLTVLSLFFATGAEECGLVKVDYPVGRVMGGKPAPEGAWPWMVAVSLREDGNLIAHCSGFMIDRKHIITAASCFDEKTDPDLFLARFGAIDIRETVPYSVKSIIVHEDYRVDTLDHDIAIIKLNYEVNLDSVTPICLPTAPFSTRDFKGVTTALVGWGLTSDDGLPEYKLQQLISMPVIDNYKCQRIFSYSDFPEIYPPGITENHICAGFQDTNKDICVGDSGAPLMYDYQGRWYAIGVTSYGINCGQTGYPGIYTRITSYLDWIDSIRIN